MTAAFSCQSGWPPITGTHGRLSRRQSLLVTGEPPTADANGRLGRQQPALMTASAADDRAVSGFFCVLGHRIK
ncbi:unnamed protein product [Didymodactylos carnosus]|uniref:Uncharacterized protein n=1 Tax=Didymodactylos carnosus TaxID=1234261 RepID=A0A814WSC3_9BILA|nr:unnamed protein product [Didymodactylos carnosus]CAF1578567.1 unnamed protein product [Didymodactylos carnosus]CAF3972107.1 unnamed protein product [Didymodactylos carnosus]CAF4377059.1 unnamed protein product [Didymodactylos carnosus]